MEQKIPRNHSRELLIVDDDLLFCDLVKIACEDEQTGVTIANSLAEARSVCFMGTFDAVLLDNNLPDGNGLELLSDILAANDKTKVILATAFPSFDHAVKAIKQGAYDYIAKPVDMEELLSTVDRAFEASRLQALEQVATYQADRQRRESVMIGFDPAKFNIRDMIRRAASSDASVLITGETGTGKNVIAKMIHHLGNSVTSPFITINCAALPETLIESELFGVEKGAFTGATQSRKGLFELAEGGTLFLDEIGEMPPLLQAKLLSALEDRRIRRIGSEKERAINVRVIAATNAAPEKAIKNGDFRSDLFYRLSVIRMHVPALRERLEDIADLTRYFIEKFAPGRRITITEDEIERLCTYSFPGNVRELSNIIERALILQEGDRIFPSQLLEVTEDVAQKKSVSSENAFLNIENAVQENLSLTELERRYIIAVYDGYGRNMARASSALGISFSTIKRKLQSFGLRSPGDYSE